MKRVLLFVLIISLALSTCMNALADNIKISPQGKTIKAPYCPVDETIRIPIGDAEYIDIGNGQVIKIADLPSFSSMNAANAYKNEIRRQTSQTRLIIQNVSSRPMRKAAASGGGTNGVQCVASSGTIPAWVSLYVSYSTSGPNNTGEITSHSAYTTFTGWTLGTSWNQTHITSRLSGTKDIYAECAGELVFYILIESLLELNRISLRLSGTCYAVK